MLKSFLVDTLKLAGVAVVVALILWYVPWIEFVPKRWGVSFGIFCVLMGHSLNWLAMYSFRMLTLQSLRREDSLFPTFKPEKDDKKVILRAQLWMDGNGFMILGAIVAFRFLL